MQSQSKRGGLGEVAEWSIAAVLKTVDLRGSGGSNPSLSAEMNRKMKIFRFFCFVPAVASLLAKGRSKQKKVCCKHTGSFLQGPLWRRGRECTARKGEPNPPRRAAEGMPPPREAQSLHRMECAASISPFIQKKRLKCQIT